MDKSSPDPRAEGEHETHPRITLRLHADGGTIPHYASALASGCDLHAAIDTAVVLEPLERTLIPTGLRIELPRGYEAQIRPRSGKALKKGLGIPNAPGTIDADYRGEIQVAVINLSNVPLNIDPDERIAQMVIAPVVQADFIVVDDADALGATQRHDGGFGSTGN
jgi:dUTP pyrophosphatase